MCGALSGTVTRCPLVLKLKKQRHEGTWRGRVSYRKTALQLQDPSQVETEILKGRRPRVPAGAALGAAPLPILAPSRPPGRRASSSQALLVPVLLLHTVPSSGKCPLQDPLPSRSPLS